MHLVLLAFPLTVVIVGFICYKSYVREQSEDVNPAVAEGYYVYPTTYYLPGTGAGAYRTAPPFAPHLVPYQHPDQKLPGQKLNPSAPTEFLKPSNFDPRITSPLKTADPLPSNGSSKIISEKTLVRDDHGLSLPQATPNLPPQPPSIGKSDAPLNPFLAKFNEKNEKPHSRPVLKTSFHNAYDVFATSGTARKSAIRNADISNDSLVSMRDDRVSQSLPPSRDANRVPTHNRDDERMQQDMFYTENSTEAGDALPRYNSGDRQIFEKYHQRISLKQDDSYIGRLRESYHPPSTVPYQVPKPRRDDKVDQKPPSSSKFN